MRSLPSGDLGLSLNKLRHAGRGLAGYRDTPLQHQSPSRRYAPCIEARQRLVGIARDTNMATGHQHHSSNRALRISYQLSYGTR